MRPLGESIRAIDRAQGKREYARNMPRKVPTDIYWIIRALLIHHLEVIGPMTLNGKTVYHVNGHALTEGDLRTLSRKQLMTRWDIFHYARIRSAKRTA